MIQRSHKNTRVNKSIKVFTKKELRRERKREKEIKKARLFIVILHVHYFICSRAYVRLLFRCDTHCSDQGHAAFYSFGEGEEHEEDEKDEGEKEDTGLKIASLGAK